MEIIWSPAAKTDFVAILLYLEEKFGLSVARKFRHRVMKTLTLLKSNPGLDHRGFVLCSEDKEVYSLLVDKHVKVVYLLINQVLYVLSLWNTCRDPKEFSDYIA